MKRVNLIYRHPLYQKKYNALQKAEEHRKFCNHTLEHFLDVARLMYIYSVEQELSYQKRSYMQRHLCMISEEYIR